MLTLPVICHKIPSCNIIAQNFGLPLADPSYDTPGEIDFLLGADIYPQIIKPAIKYGQVDQHIAMKTIFGWMLSGRVNLSSPCSYTTFHISVEENRDRSLRKFWELEDILDN